MEMIECNMYSNVDNYIDKIIDSTNRVKLENNDIMLYK